MPRTCAGLILILLVLLGLVACDNVGRAFDPTIDGGDPTPAAGESTIQVVPHGGDSRDGRPKVRAALPSGGGWPTGVPIVVEFSESINTGSIVPSTPTGTDARVILRVRGATQALPCQYDFVANGRVLVMRPLTELSNAQVPTYEVVLLPGGRDVDGLRFSTAEGGDVLTSFQVNQDTSFVDGRILTTYPRDNARDVTRETDYWVFFDRPPNANSIVANNLRLRRRGGPDLAGDRDVPLSIIGVPDPRVVRFTPDEVLTASTTHEFVVDETITFGTNGKLDFRGRTPFAVFDTIGPAAPTTVVIGNVTSGFPNKVNRANLSTVVLQVTTAADAQAGDRIRARIYGGNAATPAARDVAFIEGTAAVPAAGTQTVTVDFTGKLGTLATPKFDDGSLTIAAQTQRGSQQSGFAQNVGDDVPLFDITPPSLVQAGPPSSADRVDILTDLESLAFFGRASEAIAEASLADGVNPAVDLFASSDDGRFVMKPVQLGRLTAPRNYSLTLTDRAGNLVAAAATGRIVQRGVATGTLSGDLTVEVYDDTTLLPIANATVLVDQGFPVRPAVGQLAGSTAANGRATFSGLTAPHHTITVLRSGFHVQTLYGIAASFVSLPLRPVTAATSSLSGNVVFTPAPGTTVIVGCSAFDDTAQLDVRTTNAAPSTIPSTALVPNRPVAVTAFGGVFEPTAVPTFTLQGISLLGSTLIEPTPPLSPAAVGAQTTAAQVLIPSAGTLGALLSTYAVDFSSATGLDTANLVGGAPSIRVTVPMLGFARQLLVGVGFATPGAGATFTVNANYSFAAFIGLAPFISNDTGLIVATARDGAGRISRHRNGLIGLTGTPLTLFTPVAIPTIQPPTGPSSGSPAVSFDDVLDSGVGPSLYELTAEDANGRRWTLLAIDADGPGGTDTVQFPDLGAVAGQGLANGTWTVRNEARLVVLQSASANDMVLNERIRGETLFSRSASVPFTVQ